MYARHVHCEVLLFRSSVGMTLIIIYCFYCTGYQFWNAVTKSFFDKLIK